MNDSKQHSISGCYTRPPQTYTHTNTTTPRREGSHKRGIWLPLNLFKTALSDGNHRRGVNPVSQAAAATRAGLFSFGGGGAGGDWAAADNAAAATAADFQHTQLSQRRQLVINTLEITFTGPTWSA